MSYGLNIDRINKHAKYFMRFLDVLSTNLASHDCTSACEMWQHSNLIENPGVPFNSPHLDDWLYGIATNDCNENRIKTSKSNMLATESLTRLTSVAADSRSWNPNAKIVFEVVPAGIAKLQIIDVAAGENLQKQ
uniref:Uncharacterized protein n=1 Tax=Glossina pallidipes TaxID=7398 RepID=A0A1A9Z7R3_GLOPL